MKSVLLIGYNASFWQWFWYPNQRLRVFVHFQLSKQHSRSRAEILAWASDISLRHEFVICRSLHKFQHLLTIPHPSVQKCLQLKRNVYTPPSVWKCLPPFSLKKLYCFSKFWSIEIKINGTRWYLPLSYLKIHNTIIIILSNSLKPLKSEDCIIQIGKVT